MPIDDFSTEVSAVVITRNDNYGGYQLERFLHSLSSLADAVDEIVVVDWNQPPGRGTLMERALHECPNLLPLPRRVLQVTVTPKAIERNWPGLSKFPIIEVLARNIGIRRCTRDWILLTNPDCVLSKSIPVKKLDDNTMYTCSRSEVSMDLYLRYQDTDELITELMKHEYPSKPYVNPQCPRDGDIWSLVVCCGDFQLAHRDVWHKIRGFEEKFAGFGCGIDTNVMKKASIEANTALIGDTKLLFHLEHGKGTDIPNEVALPRFNQRDMIHNFTKTENGPNWGASDYHFDTVIL